jgi:4-hydroxybenzoate polyprenyltransferase
MYAMRWFFMEFLVYQHPIVDLQGEAVDFILLVFSTVLIAGAGNIINDYFDVKADRINKPNRLIITKHLKRRWAIVTHWVFNMVAFGIAIYLSAKHNSFVYLFIHLLSINLLWFYSMYFKRKFALGNIVIAGLTGLVPILVSIYFLTIFSLSTATDTWVGTIFTIGQDYFSFNPRGTETGQLILSFGFAMGIFAFFTNLAREVIKDAEDVEGDKLLKARTIPIVLGFKRTDKIIVLLLIIPSIIFGGFVLFSSWLTPWQFFIVFLPIAIALLFQLVSCAVILSLKTKLKYKYGNALLKLSMLFGLFTPIYLALL